MNDFAYICDNCRKALGDVEVFSTNALFSGPCLHCGAETKTYGWYSVIRNKIRKTMTPQTVHLCFAKLKDSGYDLISDLHQLVGFDPETLGLDLSKWAFRLTKTKFSKKGRSTTNEDFQLKFCPFCGEKLILEEVDVPDASVL